MVKISNIQCTVRPHSKLLKLAHHAHLSGFILRTYFVVIHNNAHGFFRIGFCILPAFHKFTHKTDHFINKHWIFQVVLNNCCHVNSGRQKVCRDGSSLHCLTLKKYILFTNCQKSILTPPVTSQQHCLELAVPTVYLDFRPRQHLVNSYT